MPSITNYRESVPTTAERIKSAKQEAAEFGLSFTKLAEISGCTRTQVNNAFFRNATTEEVLTDIENALFVVRATSGRTREPARKINVLNWRDRLDALGVKLRPFTQGAGMNNLEYARVQRAMRRGRIQGEEADTAADFEAALRKAETAAKQKGGE